MCIRDSLRSKEGERAASIPKDTAAATRAADWKPCRVACVTWQDDQTASAKASGSAVGIAMPIGVTRIAAPFVVPAPQMCIRDRIHSRFSLSGLIAGHKLVGRSLERIAGGQRGWRGECGRAIR